jgi:hypothetical protein
MGDIAQFLIYYRKQGSADTKPFEHTLLGPKEHLIFVADDLRFHVASTFEIRVLSAFRSGALLNL